MKPLPHDASDAALIAFIDGWAALMEREDYAAAFERTDHDSATNIDGVASDLTATFVLVDVDEGLSIRLRDIHVM